MTERITLWLIFGMTLALVVYDALMLANKVQGDTITEVIRKYVSAYPIIGVAVGVLIGHLFWSR